MINYKFLKIFVPLVFCLLIFTSCGKGGDARKIPPRGEDRVKKNIEEGRGFRLGSLGGNRNTGEFDFASSNELWRATLDTLDFMVISSVDYAGGLIISDWYSDNNSNEAIKITVRFLANEVRVDSLKILVHKKSCSSIENCAVALLPNNSNLNTELLSVILRKAADIKTQSKKKPVKK